jgi:hypothetical protein
MTAPDERYREPPECWVCDGIGGQRDMLTGDWLECWRCEGLGVLPRQEPVKSAEPAAALVDCPACGPRPICPACRYEARVTDARAHDLRQEAAADDRAHAWRERISEREIER